MGHCREVPLDEIKILEHLIILPEEVINGIINELLIQPHLSDLPGDPLSSIKAKLYPHSDLLASIPSPSTQPYRGCNLISSNFAIFVFPFSFLRIPECILDNLLMPLEISTCGFSPYRTCNLTNAFRYIPT